MNWATSIKAFKNYLILERSMSRHSVDAYVRDIKKLAAYASTLDEPIGPQEVQMETLTKFIGTLHGIGIEAKSQARIISGIKAYYRFMSIENLVETNPTTYLEGPKLARKLPDTLSYEEIQLIIESMDMSLDHAHRNRAIVETLYACGLRVTELVNLKLSCIYIEEEFIRVIGKNNKERLVPIANTALKSLLTYVEHERIHLNIASGHEDIVFLNRRGKQLSRVSIFNIVKQSVAQAGIRKNVSPHTFRHSFATHLVEGGADLRAVQDMLGHESITTTEIYTHVDTQFLRETLMLYHPHNT